MKLAEHPIEWIVCTITSACSPWLFPLAVHSTSPPSQAGGGSVLSASIDWPVLQSFIVTAILGMIGGAIALVRNPLPVRSFWDGFGRVLLGGAVSSLLAGIILMFVVGSNNPAVVTAIAGFIGFVSYPLVLWGHSNALGLFLKKLNVPTGEDQKTDAGRTPK